MHKIKMEILTSIILLRTVKVESVQCLLESKNINVNIKNNSGNTHFEFSLQSNKSEYKQICELLLKHGVI